MTQIGLKTNLHIGENLVWMIVRHHSILFDPNLMSRVKVMVSFRKSGTKNKNKKKKKKKNNNNNNPVC